MKLSPRRDFPVPLVLPLRRDLGLQNGERRLRRALVAALIIAGAALFAAGLWLPAKAELALHLMNRAWVETTESGGGATARPWPWADTWPVARLTLPRAREPLTVLAGASGRNLAFAPALMDGSALPGKPGVSVIAGHRDTHFRALREVALGDELTLETPDGRVLHYEVTMVDVVDSTRTELRLDTDESFVTLVTCWPFDAVTVGGSWRYLVTAQLKR